MSERGNRFLRIADRYAGVPLAMLAGLFRGACRTPSEPTRIALLKTAAIGDTVLLSAAAADLAAAFPGVELTLFTGESNFEMGRLLPHIHRVIPLPVQRPLRALGIVRRSGGFDAWIDFGQWPRLDALLSAAARSPFKIGFRTSGEFRHYPYHVAVDHDRGVHEIVNFRRLLLLLGVEGASIPALPRPKGASLGDVVVHMFPGGYRASMKEWPVPNWVALLRRLAADGHRVVLTGGKADRPRAEKVAVAAGVPGIRVVDSATTLRETMAIVSSARLLVTVNTGVMHLAAALGVPLVAIHGPTSVERWGPVAPAAKGISLRPTARCAPCLNLGFEYGCEEPVCMQSVTVADVVAAVESFIAIPGGSP